ncbi:bestrophin family protein [Rubrivivax gelatinosus]|uniref:Putative membrane protein n=1 Tax=Rubrivivax gelatinosus TaxID=28068 RepID=A0A4R2M6V9_RUBGE|nr:bestrophin family ion channel [Rubrivivax gelatinosus]MBK1688775.1 bestrophin [Rubrivivax gelatinosus]TCO98095.1 putative membrane protein [Rubrivivax gelatinosus]
MILRERPVGPRLFFVLRGSILHRILVPLAGTTLTAVVVTLLHGELLHHKITVTTIPFSLIGIALAIFLGFRNSAAYDRYWEARKLWGDVVHRSRSLARQARCLVRGAVPAQAALGLGDLRVRIVWRTVALAHALRHHLRDTEPEPELARFLTAAEWAGLQAASNRPEYLLQRLGDDLRRGLDDGAIDSIVACEMDQTLAAFAAAFAGCERIKGTPIPFAYSLLLHRTAYLYCFLLPFGLIDALGFVTPLVVAFVAYTFFGLDAVGDEIENPFGHGYNDLPLDAICRTIEIGLRESLGDEHLPPPLQPVDFWLR